MAVKRKVEDVRAHIRGRKAHTKWLEDHIEAFDSGRLVLTDDGGMYNGEYWEKYKARYHKKGAK